MTLQGKVLVKCGVKHARSKAGVGNALVHNKKFNFVMWICNTFLHRVKKSPAGLKSNINKHI